MYEGNPSFECIKKTVFQEFKKSLTTSESGCYQFDSALHRLEIECDEKSEGL